MTEFEIPERIGRIKELAYNLWWSWNPKARELFRALDYNLWRLSNHNPVRILRVISKERLEWAANSPRFLDMYDNLLWLYDRDMSKDGTWITTQYPESSDHIVAYFSAEFAIHNSLPIYAGGLGVLAGDLSKEASDLGLPLIAVGFMYPQGYFHQHIEADGWQNEINEQLDFSIAPIVPLLSSQGNRKLFEMTIGKRIVSIGAWKVCLGSVNLFLLDTDLEENDETFRQLLSRLYMADMEKRCQQEMILGIGGVRLLRSLNITPLIWHANEGHTAFMMLERIREEVEKGLNFERAMKKVRRSTLFTTHTPVLAGHDRFEPYIMENYFRSYWESVGIDQQTFMNIGRDNNNNHTFNMTALALRTAQYANAVSKLHEQVSRKMWIGLLSEEEEDYWPIMHITNGVHLPTWVAPEMRELLERYFGIDWITRHDDVGMWQLISAIPDEELWSVRLNLKRKLAAAMVERARYCSIDRECASSQILLMGVLLDPDVLTIAFVRRFAEYKRPDLIFYDIERLKKIVNNQWNPVQIIFAGKSHPADFASKQLLQKVYQLAAEEDFRGRIAFVEDYDMHMARYLVHGVDVWMNNPIRLMEACGTSGMKAAMNGVLHLSVDDGWWHEAYNGSNGWIIGDCIEEEEPKNNDADDAEAIYQLLEQEIVPLYYDLDNKGISHRWVSRVKNSMSSIAPAFCTRKMMKNYIEKIYLPMEKSLINGSNHVEGLV